MRYTDRFSIGLTGGIGVGKTTVSDHFQTLGVCVIDADEVSRHITADGQPMVQSIAQLFGPGVLHNEHSLDRAALRALVFNSPKKKQQLEQLLHPAIRKKMQQLAKLADSPYLIFSIPLLIETAQTDRFDRILVVDTQDSIRIERIKKRSGLTEDQIQKIIDSQSSRAEKHNLADDIIHNDQGITQLKSQVEALHHKFTELAAEFKPT